MKRHAPAVMPHALLIALLASPWSGCGKSEAPAPAAAGDARPAAAPATRPAADAPAPAQPDATAPVAATAPAPQRPAGPGPGGRGMGRGGMGRGGPGEDMAAIHALLAQHRDVRRDVEEIPDGVRTVTTSDDPAVAGLIRKHLREMKARVESGRPIRMWDPLFRELFAHYREIRMAVDDVPGGARVTETSANPQVVLLIRQHARAVSEFAEQGMARVHQPTPLPEGYKATPPTERSSQ